MSFTYDTATNAGLIRLRIGDKDGDNPIFDDGEIAAFLTAEGDDWRRGAALALETMASSEAMIQKVIRTLELQTDGAKLATEFRAQAAALRSQAATGSATGGALTMVDVTYGGGNTADEFATPERWFNQ